MLSFVIFLPLPAFAVDCPQEGFTKVGEICKPNNPFGESGIAGTSDVQKLGTSVINILLYVSGGLAVLFIILGGYQYITSGAAPENAKKGKKTLVYAVIGLILVVLSFTIVQVVTNLTS
jgi:hypothetical protein